MPTRDVNQAFDIFCQRLIPAPTQTGKAASHKSSITSRLENHFDLKSLFYSGSANNGTSVCGHSDVDFFAHIPAEKLKRDSSISMREVKECLQNRFPATAIRVDRPAVVLEFGLTDWDRVEVIIADYIENKEGERVFEIPGANGGWIRSSPLLHRKYISDHNDRLHKKLKRLIRLLKAWKYYRNVPISSFYLELRSTKYMETELFIVEKIDFVSVLRQLKSNQLADMQDPKGVSGYIKASKSDALRADALSKLNTALDRAEKARKSEDNGDMIDAFFWWNLVFDGHFPSRLY